MHGGGARGGVKMGGRRRRRRRVGLYNREGKSIFVLLVGGTSLREIFYTASCIFCRMYGPPLPSPLPTTSQPPTSASSAFPQRISLVLPRSLAVSTSESPIPQA